MNLLGIESYTQRVVLGGVILVAVLLDKTRGTGGVARFLGVSTEPRESLEER